MSPPAPTKSSLNPYAPEYTPQAARPSFSHPPQPAAAHFPFPPPPPPSPYEPPESFFLSTQTFSYIQPPFFNDCSAYYFTPPNPNITTHPPSSPPQPEAVVAVERRGFRGSRRPENSGKKRVEFSMPKAGKSHKVVPLKRDEEKTTITIKNIPYDCGRKELISILDGFCSSENTKPRNDVVEGSSRSGPDGNSTSAYDFVYIPIDFRTRKSRGYAFVNFTNARAVWNFFELFHLKKWDFGSSDGSENWTKKIEIGAADIQGKEAQVNHYSESIFECETDEFLPVCFDPPRDGSGQQVQLNVLGDRRSPSRGA